MLLIKRPIRQEENGGLIPGIETKCNVEAVKVITQIQNMVCLSAKTGKSIRYTSKGIFKLATRTSLPALYKF